MSQSLSHALAQILEELGWRYRRGIPPRCWQDPLNPSGELVGMQAALSRELRRERFPGEEIDRALRREAPLLSRIGWQILRTDSNWSTRPNG